MSTQARPAQAVARRARRVAWAVLLVSLPDRLVAAFLAVAVVVALALLVGVFRPALVLPVAVVAVAAAQRWLVLPPPPRRGVRPRGSEGQPGGGQGRWAGRAAVWATGAALAIAVTWFLVQVRFTGEWIGLRRDPSFYTLSALYLVHHPGPQVPVGPAVVALAHEVPGVWTQWAGLAGYGNGGPVVQIQSTSLIPGLLAIGGWFGGVSAVLGGNVLIGALSLVAVYAAGRRLLGPIWALLPLAGLAVTMPLAAFSRVPYTEPTALIFMMGMLSVLWVAAERRRPRWFAVAGGYAGAGLMARIDGTVAIVGVLLALGVLAVLSVRARNRTAATRTLLAFVAGAVPVGLLGWLDLRLHSRQYLSDLSSQFTETVVAAAGVVLVVLIAGRLPVLTRGLASWAARHRRGLGAAAAVLAAAACVAMVTRPWYWQGRWPVGSDYAAAITARQISEGLPVDASRTYDEQSVTWLAWYFGWWLVAVAAAGVVVLARRVAARRDAVLLVVVAAPAVTAALYLNRVSITPDQIWAMRRFLPAVLPGLLFAAAYAVREGFRRIPSHRIPARRALAVVAVALFIVPVISWGNLMFGVREGVGQYALVQRLCAAADGGLLVFAGPDPAMGSPLAAFQQTCTMPAVAVPEPDQATLADIAAKWAGARPITVITADEHSVAWTTSPARPLDQLTYRMWESVLSRRPQIAPYEHVAMWAGRLESDGLVHPLT